MEISELPLLPLSQAKQAVKGCQFAEYCEPYLRVGRGPRASLQPDAPDKLVGILCTAPTELQGDVVAREYLSISGPDPNRCQVKLDFRPRAEVCDLSPQPNGSGSNCIHAVAGERASRVQEGMITFPCPPEEFNPDDYQIYPYEGEISPEFLSS